MRGVDENCVQLGCHVAASGNSLRTFQDNQSSHIQGSRILFGKALPLPAT